MAGLYHIDCRSSLYYYSRKGTPDIYRATGGSAVWEVWSFQPYQRLDAATREERVYYNVQLNLQQARLGKNKKNYDHTNTVFHCNCEDHVYHPESYCKHIAYLIISKYEK